MITKSLDVDKVFLTKDDHILVTDHKFEAAEFFVIVGDDVYFFKDFVCVLRKKSCARKTNSYSAIF